MSCGFCESASSNCVGTLLVDWVAKPLKTEFDYMRHFRKNVEEFREKKKDMQSAKERLDHEIEETKKQLYNIESDIQSLEDEVKNKLEDMSSLETKIQQNKKCFNLCPNWWWRYRLSRELEKKTLPTVSDLIGKLARRGNQERVGYHAAIIPTVQFLSLSENFQASKASYKAFNEINDALRDDSVSMIGLWGMGGVGKTTLVNEVGNQALSSKLFDKVVIATVSSDPTLEKIQDEIAKQLQFNMIEGGVRRSTTELWTRLKMETSILIILDDVWEELDIEKKIGIPVGKDRLKGCKVILTTRLYKLCQSIGCQATIELGYLDPPEAWELFQKKATLENCSDEYIKKKAGKITNKCQGLPIAIVTLASALKGEKSPDVWKAAYTKLKHHKLGDIEGIQNNREKNAYLCLQMSFDYLKSIETKICFLLCSLFPEDYEIYIEDLVRYVWGLKLYKCRTIKKARSEVLAAIGTLKNSCLLLDAKKNHVKLHDMIRAVALQISSKGHDISFMIKSKIIKTWPEDEFQSCKAISLVITDQEVELPDYMVCPHLEILLLGGEGFKFAGIPSKFFERMQTLKVFSLRGSKISMDAFSGESETSNLQIRSLHFEKCELSMISSLKKLKELEILSFNWCGIDELPDEIGDLNNLRILDLANCYSLRRIPPHLISRLSKLEELYLNGCKELSWANDQDATVQENCASLSEPSLLTGLFKALTLAVSSEDATVQENCASLSELSSLTGSVKTLTLQVSFEDVPKNFVFPDLERFDICVDKEIVRRSMDYKFEGSLSRSLKVEGSALHSCKNLLRDLEVFALNKLEGYQNLVPSFVSDHGVDLNKLTCLDLKRCKHMKYLVDATKQEMIATTASFSDLEKLKLSYMDDLEELCNGPQPQGFFQNLKVLSISDCRTLRYIFPASVSKSLYRLEELKIWDCEELEEIIQKTEASNVYLQSLKVVDVIRCNKLKSLSSLCHGQNLKKLVRLWIHYCDELEYTFPTSMAERLPQLKFCRLGSLPKLKGNDIVFTLPSLEELLVMGSPLYTPSIISAKLQEQSENRTGNETSEILTDDVVNHLFDSRYDPSRLRILELFDASELQVIWKDPIQVRNFQSLSQLNIHQCQNLRQVFSTATVQSLPQLSSLSIFGCTKLEQIITNKGETSSQDHLQPIRFPSLKRVRIERCSKLKSVFPISVAHGLPKLEELSITSNSNLQQVFEHEEEAAVNLLDEHKMISLPRLNSLFLKRLPRLVSFLPMDCDLDVTLPSLRKLEVKYCPSIATSFSVDSKNCGHIRKKTEPNPSVDNDTAQELAISRRTWPIGSDFYWIRK